MTTPKTNEEAMKGDWREKLNEESKGKITSHDFDGSCCYNDNENGKGHKECRYPYNPNRENPIGTQCLRLEEEHFDIKSFITSTLSELVGEWQREIGGEEQFDGRYFTNEEGLVKGINRERSRLRSSLEQLKKKWI